MGTRHYQKVVNKEGETKVEQYGQWDGYPDGQGVDILNFLRNSNLDEYLKNINNLKKLDEENSIRINKIGDEISEQNLNYKEERELLQAQPEYFSLTRDCGSGIHKLIEDGLITYVNFIDKSEADKWCEGFFTIDFQKNLFITEFRNTITEHKLTDLPTDEEYLKDFKSEDEE